VWPESADHAAICYQPSRTRRGAVHARAYTVEQQIVFGSGYYAPGKTEGQRLLAHELAHVIQQGSRSSFSGRALEIGAADSALEREADATAAAVLAGSRPPALTGPQPQPMALLRDKEIGVDNPPDAGAKQPICDFTGSAFISIPSAPILAKLNGNKLEATFAMEGSFRTTQTAYKDAFACTCSCGEYQQLVRGKFTKNGKDIFPTLCNAQQLDEKKFQEDCKSFSAGNVRYGDRSRLLQSVPGFINKYSNPDLFFPDTGGPGDKSLGCDYKGKDAPGLKGASGDKLGVQLEFIGRLIDTCNNNQILDSSTWSVFGNATMP
jgi:Domain of unknown function (DUF4157)